MSRMGNTTGSADTTRALGYALCDASLHAHAGLTLPGPGDWPVPEWSL